MADELYLIVLVALPFAGSCVAALLGTNARNSEAYLTGAVALAGLIVVVASYPRVVGGGVVHYQQPGFRSSGSSSS